eukprot:1108963-Pleurochrysis_carterae.AAC.4
MVPSSRKRRRCVSEERRGEAESEETKLRSVGVADGLGRLEPTSFSLSRRSTGSSSRRRRRMFRLFGFDMCGWRHVQDYKIGARHASKEHRRSETRLQASLFRRRWRAAFVCRSISQVGLSSYGGGAGLVEDGH